MKLYNKTEQFCKYGHFDLTKNAGYTITDGDKLATPWYYVYTNENILLYVDQNGPVKIQHKAPSGILLCKREMGENQSKWQVWVQSADINGGVPVSNFNSPFLHYGKEKPKMRVSFTPEKAIYTIPFDKVDIVTEIFVPYDKATVCMKTSIVNKTDKDIDCTVTPAFFPYINVPQMVAWDLPEWYLNSTLYKNDNALTFHGYMRDPLMRVEHERSVTFNVDYEQSAECDLDMSKFTGTGNFFAPDCLKKENALSYTMGNAIGNSFSSYQAVFCAKYKRTVSAKSSATFTQVLTVQNANSYNEQENKEERLYFDDKEYINKVSRTAKYYEQLFDKRTIKTENQLFNNFINYFTPLQMLWVCNLDRGWPSSMRGTRDASQDYVGITPLMPERTKALILFLFEHQRTDGWMPRQVSTISRTAPHDMRYFADGGAFLLELIHEYLTFTRDYSLLHEKVVWLDSDEQSTVLEHIVQTMQYYLDPTNIGKHGLSKVWYGDWWDVMDQIGMDGIGESVTVTMQCVVNLKNLAECFEWLYKNNQVDESYLELANKYKEYRESFITALREHAFNSQGYFNGYFNDENKWLLSEKDPDGEMRVYLVSNAWGIISGAATKDMAKTIMEVVEKNNFGRMGYNTQNVAFKKFVSKAGRVGNGNFPNVAPYNHAQSFFVRACCVLGDAERAYKATRYILPIEEEYAPVEMTYAPPYALANAYSNKDNNLHRVELQFLSGTVSYVLRIYYNYFFGIKYGYDGLVIDPCLPKEFGDCEVTFTYLNKNLKVLYKNTENLEKQVLFNGEKWNKNKYIVESERYVAFFADSDMLDNNVVEIEY